MELKNVEKETYIRTAKLDGVAPSRKRFGSVWEISFGKNADFAIGKYSVAVARSGRKIILVKSYNIDNEKATYEVIDGSNEPILLKSLVRKGDKFFAYDRMADTISFDSVDNETTIPDKAYPVLNKYDKDDKRIVSGGQLLDGSGSQGKMFNNQTVNDHIVDKYAASVVNGVISVIRIISVNGNDISFEVLRSENAHHSLKKSSGFGSFTATVDCDDFTMYEYYRDAVKDYLFLNRTDETIKGK